jgi:hypothetical protein
MRWPRLLLPLLLFVPLAAAAPGSPPRYPVRGRVVTPEGQGVAGATVWFENSRRARQGRESRVSIRTGQNGSFETTLESDAYSVRVEVPEGAEKRYRPTKLPRDIELANAPLDRIEITLDPRRALSGCILGLLPDEEPTVSISQGKNHQESPAGPDGCYRFEDLVPGDWQVEAELGGGEDRRQVRSVAARVTVETGASETPFDLDFGFGRHTLTVQTKGPGRIAVLKLSSRNGGLLLYQAPDKDGSLRVDRLGDGTYDLQVFGEDDQVLARQTLELRSNRELTLDLKPRGR